MCIYCSFIHNIDYRKADVMNLKKNVRFYIGRSVIYIMLVFGACMYFFPFLWMILTSLKAPTELITNPPVFIPETPLWSNYIDALNYFPFWRYLLNSVFLVVMTTIGSLFSSSLVGYAFAKLEWSGRDIWFVILISTMILPSTVTMIPQFILFKNLGWTNSYLPLIVPTFTGSAFNIFLLRQFFKTIPIQLSESAKIDGCSEFKIFRTIIIPLSKPALATVAVFSFMGAWNDFMGPLLYVNDKMAYTLSFGLRTFQMQSGTMWNLMMAASVIVAIPTLILFFSCQKYFIEGITLTGIKD